MSVILPLFPNNIANLEFKRPVDDGIRIMSANYLMGAKSKYYGDEITLGFWNLLKLPFGSTPSPSNPLTLQAGYRYVYNHMRRTFDVYDSSETNILHKDNISTIVDLNIDFTIHKSNQFEIIVDEDMNGSRFIFPVRLVKDPLTMMIEDCAKMGVDNSYTYYGNPILEFPEYIAYLDIYGNVASILLEPPPITSPDRGSAIKGALSYFKDIFFDRNRPTNYFYMTGFSPEVFVKLLQMFKLKKLEGELLLPWLSTSMYPDLMPVQRTGETRNNRPVYEPWMIWGFLVFVVNRSLDDEDDLGLPLFDLSPRFT